MNKHIAIIVAAILTSACTPTSDSASPKAMIDAGSASQLFNAVCGSTAPTFVNYFKIITAGDFRRDPQTNTHNHVKFDVSFGLIEDPTAEICRMEFRSDENPVNLALFLSGTLAASGPMDLNQETGFATRELGPTLKFTFQPKIDGDNLHSAWIEAGVR